MWLYCVETNTFKLGQVLSYELIFSKLMGEVTELQKLKRWRTLQKLEHHGAHCKSGAHFRRLPFFLFTFI